MQLLCPLQYVDDHEAVRRISSLFRLLLSGGGGCTVEDDEELRNRSFAMNAGSKLRNEQQYTLRRTRPVLASAASRCGEIRKRSWLTVPSGVHIIVVLDIVHYRNGVREEEAPERLAEVDGGPIDEAIPSGGISGLTAHSDAARTVVDDGG